MYEAVLLMQSVARITINILGGPFFSKFHRISTSQTVVQYPLDLRVVLGGSIGLLLVSVVGSLDAVKHFGALCLSLLLVCGSLPLFLVTKCHQMTALVDGSLESSQCVLNRFLIIANQFDGHVQFCG